MVKIVLSCLKRDFFVRILIETRAGGAGFNGSGSCSGARFSKFFSSDSGSGAGYFPFMVPAPLRTKICYKSLIFVYRKSISITNLQNQKISFLACNIYIKNYYILQNF